MYPFQTQRMARFHREDLQREAAVVRVRDSMSSHSQKKQSSNSMRSVLCRGCLIAFSLGAIAGGTLTTHLGLLPIMLLGSLMTLVMSPPILIRSATTLKAHLSTFQRGQAGHWWRNSRLSR
jgi:hypothetical protein